MREKWDAGFERKERVRQVGEIEEEGGTWEGRGGREDGEREEERGKVRRENSREEV